MSFLYGVLVTFARPENLRDTLARLAEQTCPLDRLLVVDNAPLEVNAASVAGHMPRRGSRRRTYRWRTTSGLPAGTPSVCSRALEEPQRRGHQLGVLVDDDDPPRASTILEEMARFADVMALARPGHRRRGGRRSEVRPRPRAGRPTPPMKS